MERLPRRLPWQTIKGTEADKKAKSTQTNLSCSLRDMHMFREAENVQTMGHPLKAMMVNLNTSDNRFFLHPG